MEFSYMSIKNGSIHETKNKHIDWTLSLGCDHWIWPWPWPWLWIFKVKYRIHYISTKNGPIATKQKANILIELLASNVTRGLDLDLGFSRSNMEFTILWPKIVQLPGNKRQTYHLNSMAQKWSSDLTWVMTLTMDFQGKISNLLYLSQRLPHHEKYTYRTEGINDQQVRL